MVYNTSWLETEGARELKEMVGDLQDNFVLSYVARMSKFTSWLEDVPTSVPTRGTRKGIYETLSRGALSTKTVAEVRGIATMGVDALEIYRGTSIDAADLLYFLFGPEE